jgi:hypothetical protein
MLRRSLQPCISSASRKPGNVAFVFAVTLPRRQQDPDAFARTGVLSLRRKRPRSCAPEQHWNFPAARAVAVWAGAKKGSLFPLRHCALDEWTAALHASY